MPLTKKEVEEILLKNNLDALFIIEIGNFPFQENGNTINYDNLINFVLSPNNNLTYDRLKQILWHLLDCYSDRNMEKIIIRKEK